MLDYSSRYSSSNAPLTSHYDSISRVEKINMISKVLNTPTETIKRKKNQREGASPNSTLQNEQRRAAKQASTFQLMATQNSVKMRVHQVSKASRPRA